MCFYSRNVDGEGAVDGEVETADVCVVEGGEAVCEAAEAVVPGARWARGRCKRSDMRSLILRMDDMFEGKLSTSAVVEEVGGVAKARKIAGGGQC